MGLVKLCTNSLALLQFRQLQSDLCYNCLIMSQLVAGSESFPQIYCSKTNKFIVTQQKTSNSLFKPGACPQPAETRTWFPEIVLRKVCVCMYACTVDFRLLANEIDQSTHVTQLHVIFERCTVYKNHVKLDHVYGLINFIRKQSGNRLYACMYNCLSLRTRVSKPFT